MGGNRPGMIVGGWWSRIEKRDKKDIFLWDFHTPSRNEAPWQ